jgi:hypothetical protein
MKCVLWETKGGNYLPYPGGAKEKLRFYKKSILTFIFFKKGNYKTQKE